ncbi:MAG: hypothetical protein HY962_06660 [Ignavibacteriae bacterium]|nr:hypothetical protein [Ignavibacteriota bacterium]
MQLPFTPEQFFAVFTAYNDTIWPMQLVLYALAVVALGVALRGGGRRQFLVPLCLGLLWLWSGLVYHITFFAPVNPAASLFGGAFIAEGLLLLYVAWRRPGSYSFSLNPYSLGGAALVLYALLLYPLLGTLAGHQFPAAPSFGAPCPLVIFTFGILLLGRDIPKILLIIPALWSLIGFTAALTMGVYEDVGLLVAGVLGTTLVLRASRRHGVAAAGMGARHRPGR